MSTITVCLVVTAEEAIASKLSTLQNHGALSPRAMWHQVVAKQVAICRDPDRPAGCGLHMRMLSVSIAGPSLVNTLAQLRHVTEQLTPVCGS